MKSALLYLDTRTRSPTNRCCRIVHAKNLALSGAIYTLVSWLSLCYLRLCLSPLYYLHFIFVCVCECMSVCMIKKSKATDKQMVLNWITMIDSMRSHLCEWYQKNVVTSFMQNDLLSIFSTLMRYKIKSNTHIFMTMDYIFPLFLSLALSLNLAHIYLGFSSLLCCCIFQCKSTMMTWDFSKCKLKCEIIFYRKYISDFVNVDFSTKFIFYKCI